MQNLTFTVDAAIDYVENLVANWMQSTADGNPHEHLCFDDPRRYPSVAPGLHLPPPDYEVPVFKPWPQDKEPPTHRELRAWVGEQINPAVRSVQKQETEPEWRRILDLPLTEDERRMRRLLPPSVPGSQVWNTTPLLLVELEPLSTKQTRVTLECLDESFSPYVLSLVEEVRRAWPDDEPQPQKTVRISAKKAKPEPRVPTYPQHFNRWVSIWECVQPKFRDCGSRKQTHRWYQTTKNRRIDYSTFCKIVSAGEQGLLSQRVEPR